MDRDELKNEVFKLLRRRGFYRDDPLSSDRFEQQIGKNFHYVSPWDYIRHSNLSDSKVKFHYAIEDYARRIRLSGEFVCVFGNIEDTLNQLLDFNQTKAIISEDVIHEHFPGIATHCDVANMSIKQLAEYIQGCETRIKELEGENLKLINSITSFMEIARKAPPSKMEPLYGNSLRCIADTIGVPIREDILEDAIGNTQDD